jgi:hypothetical protein
MRDMSREKNLFSVWLTGTSLLIVMSYLVISFCMHNDVMNMLSLVVIPIAYMYVSEYLIIQLYVLEDITFLHT